MNTMMVALTVLTINEENGATVKYSLTDSNGDLIEQDTLENVFITGLAKYRFEHSDKFVIGQEYTSENNSKNYEACPIKLVRTVTKDDKLLFILKVVNQGSDHVQIFYTPGGREVRSRFFKSIPPSDWLRYSDYYDYTIKQREKAAKEAEQATA